MKKKSDWPSQLYKSMQKLQAKDEEVVFTGAEIDFSKVYLPELEKERMAEMCVRGSWYAKMHDMYENLCLTFEQVDSPIEQALLSALIPCAYAQYNCTVAWEVPSGKEFGSWFFGDHWQQFSNLKIELQKPIGKYTVDFFLTYSEIIADSHRNKSAWEVGEIIVECDGHDYHERTKEQASHDKARDRFLQELGVRVFRFTGSDIWKDAFGCAMECLTALKNEKFLKVKADRA